MAVQRVLLNADGSKVSQEDAAKLNPPTAKVTNGLLAGAAVRLPARSNDLPLLLAEGPETGLSVWLATGAETWIALGSMRKLEPPAGARIVVCRDDDPRYSPADRAIRATIHDWREAALNVVEATPWPKRRYDKSDFNDVVRLAGAAAVQAAIIAALNPAAAAGGKRAKEPKEGVRASLAIGICSLFALAVEAFPEDFVERIAFGCRVDVGLGKSVLTRFAAAKALSMMRQRGNKRTVAIAVPTHKLGDEQAASFLMLDRAKKEGLQASVWRGLEAPDPLAEDGVKMCRNLPATRDAMAAGMSVQTSACRRALPGGGEVKCPVFDRCGYQRQCRSRADIWFVPHEMLFFEKPDAIGELAALVVDESAWRTGLEGVAPPPITLALDALDVDYAIPAR